MAGDKPLEGDHPEMGCLDCGGHHCYKCGAPNAFFSIFWNMYLCNPCENRKIKDMED